MPSLIPEELKPMFVNMGLSPALVPELPIPAASLAHSGDNPPVGSIAFNDTARAYLAQARQHAPSFIPGNRPYLFLEGRLIQYVEECVYSGFLKKAITTLEDAITHEYYLAEEYARQDAEVKEVVAIKDSDAIRTKELNRMNVAISRGVYSWSSRVTEAIGEWKNAIAVFRLLKRQHEDHIRVLHEKVLEAKLQDAAEFKPVMGRPRGSTGSADTPTKRARQAKFKASLENDNE